MRTSARSLILVGPVVLGLALMSLVVTLPNWSRRPSVPAQAPTPVAAIDPERSLAEAIERAKASTVALEYGVGQSSGGRRVATGVVVSDRGDVLSVRVDPPEGRDRDSILARDSSGHRHPARWVAADPETGLTLLKLEADDLRPIQPARRAAILGAAVFLIGNPYGLAHSVSRGHISGLNRRLEIGPRPLGGLIQVQAPLHPGDSGALLADMQGGWLGLVRGGLAAPGSKDDDDLGFAIPAHDALWVAGQLRDHRKVDRAFLGIKLSSDSLEVGAEVSSVIADSPAEKAKLQPGDRIIKLDDQIISNAGDLTDRLDRTRAGTEVTLELIRAKVLERLAVLTTTRPSTIPTPAAPTPAPTVTPTPAPTPTLVPEPVPNPQPTPPAAPPVPNASVALPREVLDRIERLERQVKDYHNRDAQREGRQVP
jgi:S1-C subfamily serine protease